MLLGPNTYYSATGQSKGQGSQSHSTPEADIVAAEHALRTVGLPALELWDKLLGRQAVLDFYEDNEPAILAMRTGYSSVMRHTSRTHGVDLRWLASMFKRDDLRLYYEWSVLRAADIFTKGFLLFPPNV